MMQKIGAWLIGGFGNVATCAILGAIASKRGFTVSTGLVTQLPEFNDLDLVGINQIEFGGHEIRRTNLYKEAIEFNTRNNCLSDRFIEELKPELLNTSKNIVEGVLLNCGTGVEYIADIKSSRLRLRNIIEKIKDDILSFKKKHNLSNIVVVNLASVENGVKKSQGFQKLSLFEKLIDDGREDSISSSLLYAYAALDSGCAYINFTSSPGSSIPALDELSYERATVHYGKDAKTGETLVKTCLAPMFCMRNLKVLSWESHNILGNRDGLVLSYPGSKRSKITDKNGVLKSLLNGTCRSNVRIDYVKSLEDWKTAWDFIHFEGFLGVKMALQFIWQGCDSILAAPLVLDLIRLSEHAMRNNFRGPLKHLGVFFKNPYQLREHNLHKQFELLINYAKSHKPTKIAV